MANNAEKRGLETLVNNASPKGSAFLKAPYYLISGFSGICSIASFSFAIFTTYKTVQDYLNTRHLPTIPDEPPPYDAAIGYGIVAALAFMATGIFLFAAVEAIKNAREK